VKACLLASGSKGNSVYIECGETRLLIDAGLSATEITKRLESIGVDGSTLSAILITHDHTDHIKGAEVTSRKFKIPVLISYRTLQAVEPSLNKSQLYEFESGYSFSFRDLIIDPFQITHDAADPVGFIIESKDGKIGFATDMGIVTRLVTEKLKHCKMLIIESNHDEEMLMNGPYPWHLKQRIKSRHGHISNNESIALLKELLHEKLEGVFLAHLSEVNNDPSIPFEAATALISGQNSCNPGIYIGNQYRPTKLLNI